MFKSEHFGNIFISEPIKMSFTLDGVASISSQNGVSTVVNVTITNNNNKDLYIRQYLSNLNCVKEIHLNGTALQEIDTGIRKKMRGVMNTDYFLVTANGGSVTLEVPIWRANSNGSRKNFKFIFEKLFIMI
jgi:formyltetrahydrofolate synthetase